MCVCKPVNVHRCQKGALSVVLVYHSALILRTNLSLNLELSFSQLDSQAASPTGGLECASLRVEVPDMHKGCEPSLQAMPIQSLLLQC